MIATASFYGGALYFGASKKQARIISIGMSAALIVLKEVYDHSTAAKNFSGEDIAWGVVGTGAGLLIAEKITWPEEKKFRPAR